MVISASPNRWIAQTAVIGENCVCNDASELALTDENKMKAWVQRYARLLIARLSGQANQWAPLGPSKCRLHS